MSALIELRGVCRTFGEPDNPIRVLHDVDLTIEKGELVAIMGASGSGKSTLMNIIGCLDQGSEGTFLLEGSDVSRMDADALAHLRREYFGFIFQRYHLLGKLNVLDNVALPAIYKGTGKNARRERAQSLLTRLGIGGKAWDSPAKLSGGQQQRVSIARALMNSAKVILADEPTGALDTQSGLEVLRILKELQQQGHTIIIVTHDPKVAAQTHRVIEISDGRIVGDSVTETARKSADFSQAVSKEEQENFEPNASAQVYVSDKEEHKTMEGSVASLRPWQQWLNRFTEAFSMAWLSLVANKMRSILTMLGIIIGIASVVSIVSVGEGAKSTILGDLKSASLNVITLQSGYDHTVEAPGAVRDFSRTDIAAIAGEPYVLRVHPVVGTNVTARSRTKGRSISVNGVGIEHMKMEKVKLAAGGWFDAQHLSEQAQVAVINHAAWSHFFSALGGPEAAIGQRLFLDHLVVTVIGVAQKEEGRFSLNSSSAWLPYTTVGIKIMGSSNVNQLSVETRAGTNNEMAIKMLTARMVQLHGVKDFMIDSVATFVKQIESTSRTMTLFLGMVSFISLVVGGIGVMNIMLVTVTERTKEIGVRMAVGARQSDVMQQFLIEAVVVCLVGGVIGVLLAMGITQVVSLFVDFLKNTTVSLYAMLVAFGTSVMLGVLFGYLPAQRASQLNPVLALSRD
jgi:macrolide transport system ATP-binding/permease protein